MHLLIERRNHWRFELTFSSNNTTASAQSISSSSTQNPAGSSIAGTLDKSCLEEHSKLLSICETQRKSGWAFHLHSTSSRSRGLRQLIHKMFPRYGSSTIYELGIELPQQQPHESTYSMFELGGSEPVLEPVLELDAQNTSMAGPSHVQPSCSRLENNHNQRGQPLSLHTSGDTTALQGPARASTEVTNRTHTSHCMSHQTTVEPSSPDISPIKLWTNPVTNSHVPLGSVITPSESTCTPSTASPVSPTRWDNQDHPHRQYMSTQSDANDRRESSLSDYHATHPYGVIQHTVPSLNNSHRLPTPPSASSSQGSSSQPNTHELQSHAADFPRINQCSCVSHPNTYPSHISSFAAEDELNSHYVPSLEEHTFWSQDFTRALQSQSQHHPPHQRKYEYNKCLFQYNDDSPHSYSEALLMHNAEPANWKQPPMSTLFPTDQLHAGELSVSPPTTMKGEKRKRTSLADTCAPFLRPLPCTICYTQFNGPYQRANLNRHFRQVHCQVSGVTDDSENLCRICGHAYKRKDARLKHEWKKHKMLEAKPKKRRKEEQEA